MKKLVLFAAVILSMSAISCGNGEKGAAADSTDTTKQDSTQTVDNGSDKTADSLDVDTAAKA